MISIEKLKSVKRLVTHANCPDGVASALIVKDALPDVEVLFVKHGTEQHRTLEPRSGDLFCDFSPYASDERAVGGQKFLISQWVNAGAIVLDHHPTQKDVTMRFVEAGLGAYGENDRGECGAWLAYEHVWRPLKETNLRKVKEQYPTSGLVEENIIMRVREFAELAGVRDTWKKHDPRWQTACEQAEVLMFFPFKDLSLASFQDRDADYYLLGRTLFHKKLESARNAISESHKFTTPKGTHVLMFQGVTPTSDAAEELEKDEREIRCRDCNYSRRSDEGEKYETCICGSKNLERGRLVFPANLKLGDSLSFAPVVDIVAGFHYKIDGGKLNLGFSTRSHTGYDVGAFCKAHGGGGHHAAAGFGIEQSPEVGANPYAVFRLLLEEWEAGQ